MKINKLVESKHLNEEMWDSARVTDLVRYYLDRSNVPTNTLANLIQKQMKEEGSKLPFNITDFYDALYIAVDEYNSQFDETDDRLAEINEAITEAGTHIIKIGDTLTSKSGHKIHIDDMSATLTPFEKNAIVTFRYSYEMTDGTTGKSECTTPDLKNMLQESKSNEEDTDRWNTLLAAYGQELRDLTKANKDGSKDAEIKDILKKIEDAKSHISESVKGQSRSSRYTTYFNRIKRAIEKGDEETLQRTKEAIMYAPSKELENSEASELMNMIKNKKIDASDCKMENISWRPYDNEKGQVMADKWYASKYPDDETGIKQLAGITLDDALKDRSILGHCDTQVKERVYAQLDKYTPMSKESPMYKESIKTFGARAKKINESVQVLSEDINEDSVVQYEFPPFTEADRKWARYYGLQIDSESEEGSFVSGSMKNIKRFCDEYLGYEIVDEYLTVLQEGIFKDIKNVAKSVGSEIVKSKAWQHAVQPIVDRVKDSDAYKNISSTVKDTDTYKKVKSDIDRVKTNLPDKDRKAANQKLMVKGNYYSMNDLHYKDENGNKITPDQFAQMSGMKKKKCKVIIPKGIKPITESFPMKSETIDLRAIGVELFQRFLPEVLGEENWIEFNMNDPHQYGHKSVAGFTAIGETKTLRGRFDARGDVVNVSIMNGSEGKFTSIDEIERFFLDQFGIVKENLKENNNDKSLVNDDAKLNENIVEDSTAVVRYLDIEIPEMCQDLLNLVASMKDTDLAMLVEACRRFYALQEAIATKYGSEVPERHKDERTNESLEEDVEVPTLEGPTAGPESGLAAMLNSAMQDELKTIQMYNDAAVTARAEGFEDIASQLDEINTEENKHVGQLQELLKTVSPNAQAIDAGELEAGDVISVNENLNEEKQRWEEIYDSFKTVEQELNGDGEAITAAIDKLYDDNRSDPDYKKAYDKWASNE